MAEQEGEEVLLPGSPGIPLANVSDEDSAVEDVSEEDSTASLRSSILRYDVENNRTYHGLSRGKYHLPNDGVEMDRLDIMHEIWWMTWGKLFLSPQGKGAGRTLDVGTGTGIWAIDYADENPSFEVIGVDLSPIQPLNMPPNCKFEVDDVEKVWTWNRPFNFIFTRSMIVSFESWRKFIDAAFSNLESDGWLEIQDHTYPLASDDGTLDGTRLLDWSKLMVSAASALGRPIDVAPSFKALLEEAGFVDVQVVKKKVPLGGWAKDGELKALGRWTGVMFDEHLAGLTMRLFKHGLQWTDTQVQTFLAGVREDRKRRSIHAYSIAYGVYGRKLGSQGLPGLTDGG